MSIRPLQRPFCSTYPLFNFTGAQRSFCRRLPPISHSPKHFKINGSFIAGALASVLAMTSFSPQMDDPHFLFPAPNGRYPVGFRTIDKGLECYYPGRQNKPPKFRVLNNGWTRSQPGLLPICNEKIPIVVFFHSTKKNLQFVENLASHGFCVLTVETQEGTQELLRQIKQQKLPGFNDFFTHTLDLDAIAVINLSDLPIDSVKVAFNSRGMTQADILKILDQHLKPQIPCSPK